ncbi:MAG: SWIM zinc finger family protein [Deltaproteobacteria bacterium]|nr:SWIM zinc finger family protein [Deltaproteobacteria bacterium]
MGYWGFPRYVTVAEKKAKAAKKLKQLKKKNPDIKPVTIEGRTIAKTWWGKSWNLNLERYADYSNRIGRGRSYVRHGAVLDLQIHSGRVDALVQGSGSRPYSVTIAIKPIHKKHWQNIKAACTDKLDSLQELLSGKFPKALADTFMAQGIGLFPSPKEIEFSCSCPDWAYMCKHVAAVLYGIGARLDEDPGLFFKLRKARIDDLVTEAVKESTSKLLKKTRKKPQRVIADTDLADLFGIDMEGPADFGRKKSKTVKKIKKPRKAKNNVVKEQKAKFTPAKPGKQKITKKTGPAMKIKPPFDTVVGIIRRSRRGITLAQIKIKTGFDDQQVRKFIIKARNQKKIRSRSRGVYVKA